MPSLGEFDLIRTYFEQATPLDASVLLGIGDDCALLAPRPGHVLALTVDTNIADRHFPATADPYLIGWRCLAVNLSDLAAMGARPRWMTLALTLPEAQADWLQAFSRGLAELCAIYGVNLVGGDTTRGTLSVTIQAMGELPAGQALRRDGAKSGDRIYVSGTLGDAHAGLKAWLAGERDTTLPLLQAYLKPLPQVALGQALLGVANSAIDISDGLLADLGHIGERSGLGARLAVERLPLSQPLLDALGEHKARLAALSGGDDYQLCFTVSPEAEGRLPVLPGVSLTCIGEMVEGSGVRCYDAAGQEIVVADTGFQHF